jgi:hypothetical protein
VERTLAGNGGTPGKLRPNTLAINIKASSAAGQDFDGLLTAPLTSWVLSAGYPPVLHASVSDSL